MNGRIQEATALINQLHPELLDNDRYLYFHLQQLHLIELIRNNRVEEALAFAQSHLSEAGEEDPNVLSELERTLALLAFEDPVNSPFGDLLQNSHRQKVVTSHEQLFVFNPSCDVIYAVAEDLLRFSKSTNFLSLLFSYFNLSLEELFRTIRGTR